MSVKKTAWYFVISILLIVPVFLILTAIHSFLPLLVLFLFWGGQHMLFKNRNLTNKQAYSKRKATGIFLITAIACSIAWFFYDANFFAMGPFYPQDFNENYITLTPKDSIAYKAGYLVTHENKDIKKPSVLVYKTKDGIVWGQELNAPDIFWYEEEGGKPS
ncbi:hypothetical protein [Aureicoccus marinus]|nr:hypothetical protein [Aureicoccus marinus]